jgi:16S rRNA (uracil1498-N3)-methyltransferase
MVERDDRAPVASIFTDAGLSPGAEIALDDSASHHVRVKRLEMGDVVRLLDGNGAVGTGSIVAVDRRSVKITVDRVETAAPQSPIHLRVPIADRDRMLWLAEKATELGVTTWQAVRFRRSASVSPRGEGAAFVDKVHSRMIGALEQSGSAWLPRILPDVTLDRLVVESEELPILLDVGGQPLSSLLAGAGARSPLIVFGPEGGLEADEVRDLAAAGWHKARLAATILRFETAGLAAIAVCRNAQMITEI